LSLCFNWAPRHEGVLGERRYSSTHSLTSALDGGEWSALRQGKSPTKELTAIRCHLYPIQAPTPYLFTIHFNIVLSSTSDLSNCTITSGIE
jgi:hypothetical protein